MGETEYAVLYGRGGAGDVVSGSALVSRHAFSPRYDLDRSTGKISRAEHDLIGKSLADKIVFFSAPKGGVAAGWALYTLRAHRIAPLAFVFTSINPVFVQGAVHAGIPIVHGFDDDPVETVKDDDVVRVDPPYARLAVLERHPTEGA